MGEGSSEDTIYNCVGENEVQGVSIGVGGGLCVLCVSAKEEVRRRSWEVAGLLALMGMLKSPRMMVGSSEER
ncbi:unnamed protein product, partial [Staurois parvus]